MILIPLTILVVALILTIWWFVWRAGRDREAAKEESSHVISGGPKCAQVPGRRFACLWAASVAQAGYLGLVTGDHNVLVLGTRSAGRPEVMMHAVYLINLGFREYKHAAVYIDVEALCAVPGTEQWTSPDFLYRMILMAPTRWLHSRLATRSRQLLTSYQVELERTLTQQDHLSPLANRRCFYAWMQAAGLESFSFFLDDLSYLPPDLIPVVLQMLIDTFPQSGKVSLKLGGTQERLRTDRITKRGRIGMQLGHEVMIGLDLSQLLMAGPSDLDPDPREIFVASCLSTLAPSILQRSRVASISPIPFLFKGDSWRCLYSVSDFDVELVGSALDELLPETAGDPSRKADEALIQHAVYRAKNKAMLLKE